jgi:transcription elongation factor Elf1
MFDLDFEYNCPYCNELFLGEHNIDNKIVNKILICDLCGNKYKLTSKAILEIECEVTKFNE